MDMTQQLAVLSLANTEGRALGSNHINHTPRSNSPASTHSGSSPGTSQGKASMDIERNTRPVPDKFTQSASRELFLTSPNRRMASIPLPLPSHLDLDRPVSSAFPDSSDSYASIASFQASARGTEFASGTFSSSSCAATIAARTAAAYSTPQSTSESQPPDALSFSHLLPTSTHFSSHQRLYTTPQQLAPSVEASDASSSSLNVLSDGQDAPLPPIERASNHPASLTPGFPPIRTTTSHPAPTPLPTKFSIEGVSARLSPAIITRQPQYPILSLPPISPTSPPANDSRRLRSGSLRSVPALPMEGSDDREPAEHDNADLDDLDEEDEGVVDGDDTEEESPEAELPDTASEDGESSSSPHSSEASRPGNLPAIDVSPLDLSLSFQDANMSGTIRQDDKTPKGYQMNDYFSSKRAEPSSHIPATDSQWLPTAWASAWTAPALPASTPSRSVFAAGAISASRALPTPTTPTLNSRSRMYHQASRSMSDMAEILRQHRTPEVAAATPKSPLCDPAHEADPAVLDTQEPDTDTQLGPPLRRRLSMPTFGPSTEPPPYPAFRFGEPSSTTQIEPRDEEGYEHLPDYTNDIYLRAIMPRKMEFTAPGVQARDRKWRRTLCILEGTAFRVYRCPSTASGKGLIGNLWEKTVGVGDIATPSTQTGSNTAKVKERESDREARPTKLDGADAPLTQSPTSSPTLPSASGPSQPSNDSEDQPSPSSTRSRLLPSNFRRKNRAASDGPSTSRILSSPPHRIALESISSQGFVRPPTPRTVSDPTVTPMPGGALRTPTPRMPRTKRRHLWVDDPAVPLPQEQDLVYAYKLDKAESGLGSDYLKRRNVIRIRMEGQQFLLQARDVAGVVDWIEVRPFVR